MAGALDIKWHGNPGTGGGWKRGRTKRAHSEQGRCDATLTAQRAVVVDKNEKVEYFIR